jgi:hypothetical protein
MDRPTSRPLDNEVQSFVDEPGRAEVLDGDGLGVPGGREAEDLAVETRARPPGSGVRSPDKSTRDMPSSLPGGSQLPLTRATSA